MAETLAEAEKQILNKIECYQLVGSGWFIAEYITLDATIWKLDPLRSYHKLALWLKNTKCIINVKNTRE